MSERPVKDKNGGLITDEEGQKKRLVDHFQELLYRPTPVNPPKIPPAVELEEQKRTKENLRKRMREVKKLDITTDNLVKSLESSLKEKEHEVKQEQQRNRELDAKFKNLLQEKESIEAQINENKAVESLLYNSKNVCMIEASKILDNHYTEKSELSSKIKSLQEEKKKLKDELAALEELNAQLVEESNRIIDHTNTNQKIQLCDKKNQENNEPTKDVEHEKIMLVKQLTQFRSKYNYITRQKDKEIQRLKSELERQYEKE
ncbi:chromosome partition protein Smc-like [Biomphalaria glabrata]|uniref:Chromosome partition protein Smc-like n=1 Tax=Biomphalaria glabrata TaxID=6526 RepID=A0A9W2ZET1_BIOGL|nr:chromosome partition protein Smc-like [Biomphalaria glabrata]